MSASEDRDAEALLEEALAALDEGRPAECLRLLDELPDDVEERALVAAEAWLDLGELDAAESALASATLALGEEDPEVRWLTGRLRLAQWRTREAAAALRPLARGESRAAVLTQLALVAEIDGELREADRMLAEAARLDPEAFPVPPRLAPARFLAVVQAAAEDLPDAFRATLERVAVVIDPMPSRALSEHPPDILGLYSGPPLGEYDSFGAPDAPPTIFLFQRNLERAAASADDLREEIRVTLYHELAHALGFEEEDMEELGLE